LHREYQILSESITPNKLSKHNLELLSANLDGRERQIRNGLSELEDVLESIRSNRLAKMQETMNSSRKIMLFIMATFVIINIIIWLILKLKILAPLKILERGARSIGEGELGLQIDVNTKNEIRELVDVLNRMSLQLKDNQDTQAKLSKLETISQIVTSVNHEINNPLMIISGNAEFMLKVIGGDSEKIAKRLNAIIREVRRIFDVTQRLKEIKNPVVDKYVTEDTSMIDLKRSS
jgi:nitrogen fixation/metabolism regulation signal transduction histidine kinase